jgi:uncharacterized membrane protein YfcA
VKHLPRAARVIGSAAVLVFVEIFLVLLVIENAEPASGVVVLSFVFLVFATAIHRVQSLHRFGTFWWLLAFQFTILVISTIVATTISDFGSQRILQGALAIILLIASIYVYLGRTDRGPESTQ